MPISFSSTCGVHNWHWRNFERRYDRQSHMLHPGYLLSRKLAWCKSHLITFTCSWRICRFLSLLTALRLAGILSHGCTTTTAVTLGYCTLHICFNVGKMIRISPPASGVSQGFLWLKKMAWQFYHRQSQMVCPAPSFSIRTWLDSDFTWSPPPLDMSPHFVILPLEH